MPLPFVLSLSPGSCPWGHLPCWIKTCMTRCIYWKELIGCVDVYGTLGDTLRDKYKETVKSGQLFLPKLVEGTVGNRILNRCVPLMCAFLLPLSCLLHLQLCDWIQANLPSQQNYKMLGDNDFDGPLEASKFSRSARLLDWKRDSHWAVCPGVLGGECLPSAHTGSQKCKVKKVNCIVAVV